MAFKEGAGSGGSTKSTADQKKILALVENLSQTIEDVSQQLWKNPEISLEEIRSAQYLKEKLTGNGFKITSDKVAGVDTAFVAEFHDNGTPCTPIIGVMLEYDALPGLGNKAVPRKEPCDGDNTAGHGCGHNLIGSGALGAALALKEYMDKNKIPGTLRVYGGAAEETEGAKVYMARAGIFNGVDAMLHWHPWYKACSMNVSTAATNMMYIEFTGKSAHAGLAPWNGRNALSAVEVFLHSVNMMREHLKPTDRVSYIIKDGGDAPNIIPDKASVILCCRGKSRAVVQKHVLWLKDMVKGAALATDTEGLAIEYFGLYEILPNDTFAKRVDEHLTRVGIPEYTDEEIKFAKQLQESVLKEKDESSSGNDPVTEDFEWKKQKGMTDSISDDPHGLDIGGSTDVGDVSWFVPTMGVVMPGAPLDVNPHTWAATASYGSSIGTKAAIAAAKVLALTGLDLFTDPEFLEGIKKDFDDHTKGFEYVSPVNSRIEKPVGGDFERLKKYFTK